VARPRPRIVDQDDVSVSDYDQDQDQDNVSDTTTTDVGVAKRLSSDSPLLAWDTTGDAEARETTKAAGRHA